MLASGQGSQRTVLALPCDQPGDHLRVDDRLTTGDPADCAGELLESASKEAGEAIAELRELARGIHPAVLTESGLAGAIQSLAERSPVPVVIGAVPAGRFPAPVEATAYFVMSEALANVAKHAPRATARVTISQRTEQLVVEVSDDGPGGARPEAGSGLRGLADRVASVGGTLRVEDAADRGTRIEAAIPCR